MELLAVRPGGLYVDGTLGLAGHAGAVLEAASGTRVVGFDKDGETLERARAALAPSATNTVEKPSTNITAEIITARFAAAVVSSLLTWSMVAPVR